MVITEKLRELIQDGYGIGNDLVRRAIEIEKESL